MKTNGVLIGFFTYSDPRCPNGLGNPGHAVVYLTWVLLADSSGYVSADYMNVCLKNEAKYLCIISTLNSEEQPVV